MRLIHTIFNIRLAHGLALLLLPALGACRVGNHTETQPAVDNPTGYYRMEAKRMSYYAKTTTTGTEVFGATNLNPIPDKWDQFLGDPEALYVKDPATSEAALLNVSTQQGIKVAYKHTGELTYAESLGTEQLSDTPPCTSTVTFEGNGNYVRSPQPNFGGQTIIGTIGFTVKMSRSFDGSCATRLTFYQNCIQHADQCGGKTADDNQKLAQYYHNFFQEYFDAGTMTLNDLPNLVKMGYVLVYE